MSCRFGRGGEEGVLKELVVEVVLLKELVVLVVEGLEILEGGPLIDFRLLII